MMTIPTLNVKLHKNAKAGIVVSMSESYTDSVRLQLLEREAKVEIAIGMLQQIVRRYSYFEDGSEGNPLALRSAPWKGDEPGAFVYLDLRSGDDKAIPQADVDPNDKAAAVNFATFELSYDGYKPTKTVMTIETLPPNIVGFDGAPLATDQLDGALADLQYYANALAKSAGHGDQ
jgi:hypothetical protein